MPTTERRPTRRLAAVLLLGAIVAGCQDTPPPEVSADFADADVVLVGNNQLEWDDPNIEVEAGEVVFGLTSDGAVNHNLVIEGVIDEQPVVEAGGNASSAGRVTVDPGTYEFWCSIPGHEAAGMVGTLTVTPAAG